MKEGDKFEVEYSEYALEFLKKADRQLKKRIVKKIEYLAKNFDKLTHFPLSYEASDFFKLRIGKYRVIYTVDWKSNKLKIALIDRRDKIYKILKRFV
jgi:mRNA interferase RelE/StbE